MSIDTHDNTLSFQLAKSVGEYFQLSDQQMDEIINNVISVTQNWKQVADKIGISRNEQEIMAKAFSSKLCKKLLPIHPKIDSICRKANKERTKTLLLIT